MDVIWSVLEGLDFEPTTFTLQVILFCVLHVSLDFIIYRPLMHMRNKRDARLASSLAAAETAAAEARGMKDSYEETVRAARAEGQVTLVKATEVAEAERKARVDKAREEAGEILAQARAEAEAARAKALAGAQAQAEEVCSALLERLFVASLGSDKGRELATKVGGAKS